jgi:hypothetical protein
VGCIRAQTRELQGRLLIDPSSSPRYIMSAGPSTSTSQSNFASIFNAALKSYQHKTKKDLASHPLLPSLQSCDSPEAVLTVLRDQTPTFNQSQNSDDRLTKWVAPTVNVLYAFSATIGQGVGLVCIGTLCRGEFPFNIYFQAFPAANAIFAGIGVLLLVSILYVLRVQAILTPGHSGG